MKHKFQAILVLVMVIGLGSSLLPPKKYAQMIESTIQSGGTPDIWSQMVFAPQPDHAVILDPLATLGISGEDIQSTPIQLYAHADEQSSHACNHARPAASALEIGIQTSSASENWFSSSGNFQ